MSLAPMTRIDILIPKYLQTDLLGLLQQLETVEITECLEADLARQGQESSEAVFDHIEQLEVDLKKVGGSIKVLRERFRPKQSLIDQFASLRTPVAAEEYLTVASKPETVISLCDGVQDLERRWSDLQKAASDYQRDLAELQPWMALDIPVKEVGETTSCISKLGSIDSRELAAFTEEVANLPDTPLHFETVNEQAQKTFLFFLYAKENQEQVEALLTKYGFAETKLPQGEQNPVEEHQRIQAQLTEIKARAHEVHAELGRLNETLSKLLSLNDILSFELKKATVAQLFGDTGHVSVISGWCRQDQFEHTKQSIETALPVAVVESREPLDDEVPPVAFDNPKLVAPYENITTTAGVPRQGSPDPTPGFAPFFFIFFGVALGDAGYGILLTVMSLWLMKRTRAVGDGRKFLHVLMMGGIATFIFGVLTGSWFGDLIPIPPIWFNPANEPIRMLVVALGLGVVHLFVGLGVTFVHNLKQGRLWDALFDQALWWVFITGIVLVLIGAKQLGQIVAVSGGIGLVLTQGRHEKSILKKAFKGISSLMGITSWLSDVLSYSRLLALGLASGVIGVVINDVSEMVSGIPVVGLVIMAVILAFGHVFNLLINVISAYVHSSRLQYVEFFGKCFESGGRLFQPFALRTKMVQVIAEQESVNMDTKGGAF